VDLRYVFQSPDSGLEDSWACSTSAGEIADVAVIDVDHEPGERIWDSHRLEPPVAVALSQRTRFAAGRTIPRPISVGPVACLFNELSHGLRSCAGVEHSASTFILVAHPDEDVLAALRQATRFQTQPIAVLTASSGREAMSILRRTKVALAMIVMPLPNGFELLADLRDHFKNTLRIICGGPGTGAGNVEARVATTLHQLSDPASVDVVGTALMSTLDLKPAGSGFLHRCSNWSPVSPAPAPATPIRRPSRRDLLAREEVDFELSHFKQSAIEAPARVPVKPPHAPVLPIRSFAELMEEGFEAFRAKDYARAEACWAGALQLNPDDGPAAYNLRMARKRMQALQCVGGLR